MREHEGIAGAQGRNRKAKERTGMRGNAGKERREGMPEWLGIAGERGRPMKAGNRGMLEWLGGLEIAIRGSY